MSRTSSAEATRTATPEGPFEPVAASMTIMNQGVPTEVSLIETVDGEGRACWEQTTEDPSSPDEFNVDFFPTWASDGTRPGSPLEGTASITLEQYPRGVPARVMYGESPPSTTLFGPPDLPPAGDPNVFPLLTTESCSGAAPQLRLGEPFDANRTLLFNVEQQGNQAPVINVPVLSPNGPGNLSVNVGVTAPGPLPASAQTLQWLTATLNQTATPAALRVELDTDGLAVGEHRGTITITSPGSQPIDLTVLARIRPPRPYFAATALLNAAGQQPGAVSPGMAFVIFGANFGPSSIATLALGDDGRVTRDLAGIRVLFDGEPAPMIFSLNGQISGFTPFSVAGKDTVEVEVEWLGETSRAMTIAVLETTPGFFTIDQTGGGAAAALNSDNTVNLPGNRALAGEIVQFFGTGPGQTIPGGVDGQIIGAPLPQLEAETEVWIGGVPAEVVYSGPAPGLVNGVWQLNARIAAGVEPGDRVQVRARVGQQWTQPGVTVAVR